ncbi:MAG: heme o synthase [Gammaproteobacteria bacterium]|nr:heme o synthase [Gammaproteobacteria bacterium]MCZ6894252.1 heme o synthase [Gammaproteobacteria bacterium]
MRASTTAASASIGHWRDYAELCKPRVVGLIVFTAVVGMLLSTPGAVPLAVFIPATLGIGLAAASAAAINHVAEYRIDALMARTRNRPLPQGELNRAHALAFALILGGFSMYLLIAFVNVLTAVLTFASLIGYAVIYTMYLKYATPQNIVIGGAAGAAPPVLGWTAVTGQVDPHALLLFLIIFAWTPPHFWALAIYRRDEYANAKIPMLPITHGVDYTRRQILLYTLILVIATLLPFVTYMSGVVYLCGAILLDAGFLYYVIRMQTDHDDALAIRTFKYSIIYLMSLFIFFFLDHYWAVVLKLIGIA